MKKFLIIVIIILMSLPTLSAIAEKPIIGVILPFSSAFSGIAEEQKNAIDLVVTQLSPTYEIIYKDSKADAEGGVKAFNELMNMENPPIAIISCASWVAEALHPLTAEKGIFHIVIGSASFNRSVPNHTVRFTIDAKVEEKQLAYYLSSFKKLAIFNMDNGYGNGWAKIIKNNFSDKVVSSISYDPQKKDFTEKLKIIKENNPDALILLSAGNGATIAEEARNLGIRAQFVGTRPIQRQELLQKAEFTNGLVYTYPSYDANHPIIKEFEKAYKMPISVFGIEAYDAITTLIQALSDTDDTPETLFAWYASRTYQGALGKVTFDKVGDANYPYLYKEINNGEFQVAEFQYPLLLQKTKIQIDNIFNHMDETTAETAKLLSSTGLTSKISTELLQKLFDQNEYSYDVVTIDKKGIIVNVAPENFKEIVGENISSQEQVKRIHATKKPVVSKAILTVEGFIGFDLQHPVFDTNGEFIGSVSVLTEPEFFGQIISGKVVNFPVEIWLMQKDGEIIYDVNKDEIGRNLFTDELYKNFESLKKVGKQMVESANGEGEYEFFDSSQNQIVKKKLIWTTIMVHSTEFRLALAHKI